MKPLDGWERTCTALPEGVSGQRDQGTCSGGERPDHRTTEVRRQIGTKEVHGHWTLFVLRSFHMFVHFPSTGSGFIWPKTS